MYRPYKWRIKWKKKATATEHFIVASTVSNSADYKKNVHEFFS